MSSGQMSGDALIRLDVGMSRTDRMLPILLGDVVEPGLELSFASGKPSAIFWRALHEGRFDVTEMSLAAHAILTSREENPFVGLPVFTSRMFRHGTIYVRADAGINRPADLAGRRIGIPEYQMTAAVWLRGILQNHYGVGLCDVTWITGGVNEAGRKERLELRVPVELKVCPAGDIDTLDGLLLGGEIDAIMAPQMPASFRCGDPRIQRLFSDSRSEEEAYFRQTGIFPIMHLLVVRREKLRQHPGLSGRLVDLFSRAKDAALAELYDSDALYVSSPWLIDDFEQMTRTMGDDFWPYGIEANAHVLKQFLDYLAQQSLLAQPVSVADLFA